MFFLLYLISFKPGSRITGEFFYNCKSVYLKQSNLEHNLLFITVNVSVYNVTKYNDKKTKLTLMKHNKTLKKNMSDNKVLRTVYYTYTVQNN